MVHMKRKKKSYGTQEIHMERWNDGRFIGQDKTGKENSFQNQSKSESKTPSKNNPKSTKKRPKIHIQINKK